jgi:hypothetical protein
VYELRESQIDALKQAAYGRFRERAITHVKTHFPNHARVVGDAVLEQTVDFNLAQGKLYGMTTERSALLYLTTAIMLGSGFDHSPAFDWAGDILRADRRPVDRARDLAYTALDFQKRIAGQGNKALNRAYLTLARMFDQLGGPGVAAGFEAGTAAGLRYLHAERADAFGPAAMERLAAEAAARAEGLGFEGSNGSHLIGVAMFFIGWDPFEEPFTPWAREAAMREDGHARQGAFFAAARDFLHRWLERPRQEA